ncbi:hypothetical protein ACFY2W_35865 [Streptomyces sp. NPDC001262]|uniref:hypothetical protein n=1 Tax=Streptomyces sp. NPDC001262 TaxID=3364552 RepID=UPI003695D1C6
MGIVGPPGRPHAIVVELADGSRTVTSSRLTPPQLVIYSPESNTTRTWSGFSQFNGKHQMVPGWPYSVLAALETGRTSWRIGRRRTGRCASTTRTQRWRTRRTHSK